MQIIGSPTSRMPPTPVADGLSFRKAAGAGPAEAPEAMPAARARFSLTCALRAVRLPESHPHQRSPLKILSARKRNRMADSPKPVSQAVEAVVAGLDDAVDTQALAEVDAAINEATEAIESLSRWSKPARGREPSK